LSNGAGIKNYLVYKKQKMTLEKLSHRQCACGSKKLKKINIFFVAYLTQAESILTNEKYKGDALLQKVYTVDFLSKKKKVNEGEVPQYYVEGNHEAIIEPSVFDWVQVLMKARRPGKNRNSCVGIFSGKIKCGDCGGWYGSKVWHSNDKYRKVIWQCNHKFDGGEKCTNVINLKALVNNLYYKMPNNS